MRVVITVCIICWAFFIALHWWKKFFIYTQEDDLCTKLNFLYIFRIFYFQLEVKYVINVTPGHVLLSSDTNRTVDSGCSLRDVGTVQHHHTSVSCRPVSLNTTVSSQILVDSCYCIASLIMVNFTCPGYRDCKSNCTRSQHSQETNPMSTSKLTLSWLHYSCLIDSNCNGKGTASYRKKSNRCLLGSSFRFRN